jgi:precorrin-6B methylase 2
MEATFLISILQLSQDAMLVDIGAPTNSMKFINFTL